MARASLLAVNLVVIVNCNGTVVVPFVQCHLLIIHRLRSRVYTLQVNNSKISNLFAYVIAARTATYMGFQLSLSIPFLMKRCKANHFLL